MKSVLIAVAFVSSAAFAAPVCQDGETKFGYTSPSVSGDDRCQQGSQICSGGAWVGPYIFESCLESTTKSCDGYPHGSTQTGYLSLFGNPDCISASRTCLDGTWAGPYIYSSCNEGS